MSALWGAHTGCPPPRYGNNEHPADYRHPSMSVSDLVAIKHDGKVSCHYCDSFGFEPVPGFLPDNPLKNAEMAVEDDYGMIDGIINNLSLIHI